MSPLISQVTELILILKQDIMEIGSLENKFFMVNKVIDDAIFLLTCLLQRVIIKIGFNVASL